MSDGARRVAPDSVSRVAGPPPPRPSPNTGRLVLGIVLILLGAGWFVDTVGIVEVRWAMVLPAVLVVIGLALLATAHRGTSGGLVAAGIFISFVVVVTSVVTIPFTGQISGVGDVTNRLSSVDEFDDGYGLGMGQLEIDLRALPAPGEPVTLQAGVAVGQLVVRVPDGVTVEVHGRAGMGEVNVEGRTYSGLGIDQREVIEGDQPEPVLVLELSVGMGQVEVRR